MSAATNVGNPQSCFSETAEVRLVSRQTWPRSYFSLTYVLVSSRLYWKVANEDRTDKPQSFLDFRNAASLEIVRLGEGTWKEVDETVKVDDYEWRTRITVQGRLHGGAVEQRYACS